ncbi:hypothetical protein GBA52_015054, partial [Prunus armeniaca]
MGTVNGEASMMFAPKFANNHIVPKGPCGYHIKLGYIEAIREIEEQFQSGIDK